MDGCPNCHWGRLKPRRSACLVFYGATLVQVPNAPAWTCDTCGFTIFDQPMLRRLDVLIGEAGPPPNTCQAAPSADPDAPAVLDPPAARPRTKSE